MSINDYIIFLENMKQELKRTISWNKCRSKITTQPKNNLGYLIDLTFKNISRLFLLSFKNGGDDPTRNSFDRYYIPLVEIEDLNALINNKSFFDQPLKTNKKCMKNLSKRQNMRIIQQENYYIFHIIKIITNILAFKQI